MNSSINIASPNIASANEVRTASAAKNTRDGFNNAESDDLAASAESFHESIKKAYDDSKNTDDAENTDHAEKDPGGNILPDADDFPEIAAQDDRAMLPGGLYLSGQLPGGDTPADNNEIAQLQTQSAEAAIDSETEIDPELTLLSASVPAVIDADPKTGSDSKLNEIATQLRQLLNAETRSDTKNAQSLQTRTAATNADAAANTVENTLIQQAENLALKTDLTGLNGDKTNIMQITPTQQAVSSIQTSLLLQAATATAAGDTGSDAMPLASHAATSNFSTMTASSVMPQPAIAEAFGRPAWSQGMSKQILLMVNQNISTAEIRLNPAHLGPIEVLIDMSEEQVSVSMSSRHANVREAMEQALPKLREMLEQNGFSLADADISKHSFAEQREQNADNNSKGFANRETDNPAAAEASGQQMRQTAMSTSMVDYYI